MKTKILGIDIHFVPSFNFYCHGWHLAMTTKYMKADCCNFIGLGFLHIEIWGYKGWIDHIRGIQ